MVWLYTTSTLSFCTLRQKKKKKNWRASPIVTGFSLLGHTAPATHTIKLESLIDELTTQVYLDLTLNKKWEDVKVIRDTGICRPVIVAQDPEQPLGFRRVIMAVSETQSWTLKDFEKYFVQLSDARILNSTNSVELSTLTMAIVAQDSTTVYYDIHSGLKKPGNISAQEIPEADEP